MIELLGHGLDRRQYLMGLGAAASSLAFGTSALAMSGGAGSATGGGDFDPLNKQDNLDMFMRLTGTLDETEDSFGWYQGRIFTVIDDFTIIQPLFDVEGFGVSRTKRQEDGSYRKYMREVGFYKDLRTGQIMESWENPMTGETVEVFPINNDPVNAHLKQEFPLAFGATEDETVQMMPFLLPWTFVGDSAMAAFDVNLDWKSPLDPKEWPKASPGERVRVSEYQQWSMSMDELNDRSLPKVFTVGGWQRIANWLPWMLMGQAQGHLFYRAHTKALTGVEEIPADIRAYAEKNYPKYFEAPTEWVTPNVSSFEVYARDAKAKREGR